MFHDLDGRRIHSVSFGAGESTLVAMAGSIASWEIWSPVFEVLSRRHRVVSFDHEGVGQTRVPVDEITAERRLVSLFSVLDHHDVGRCVIAGDSNNASVAIQAVAAQPERFAGLAIVSGHAWGYDYPAARGVVASLRSDFEATVGQFVELVFPEPETDHLKRWLLDIIHQTGAETSATIIESYFDLDLRPVVRDLDVRAVVIFGGLDSIGPHGVAGARELATLLNARLEIIEDAGHLPLLSRPQRVAAELDAFLNDVGP